MAKICSHPSLGLPSVAQLYFDGLRKRKLLFPWVFYENRFPALSETDLKNLYQIIYHAVTKPQKLLFRSIFLLREHIHPSLWFCAAENLRPAKSAVPFIPSRAPEDLLVSDTLGVEALRGIKESGGLSDFLEKRKIGKNTALHYFYGGSMRRTPTARDIFSMADAIPPESWFIFPDEVSGSAGAVSAEPVIRKVMEFEKDEIRLFRKVVSPEIVSSVCALKRHTTCGEFLCNCYREAAERCGILDKISIVPCGTYSSVRWREDAVPSAEDEAAAREFCLLTRCEVEGRA